MKTKSVILFTSVALCACPVFGQRSSVDDRNNNNPNTPPSSSTVSGDTARENQAYQGQAGQPDQTVQVGQNGLEQLGKLDRAEKIIGEDILNTQDKKIGVVKDLAVDVHNGRLVAVIAGTGGMLGLGEKYAAAPPSRFTRNRDKNALQFNGDEAKLTDAPAFNLSHWETSVSQPNLVAIYQYYNVQPYFATTEPSQPMGRSQLGLVERADKILGTTVENMEHGRLGKAQDFLVSLQDSRLAEVIIASGGFLGLGDEFSGVPPQAFQRHDGQDELLLDITKEALAKAPHFKSSEWPNLENPDQVAAVYRAYNIQPWFTTSMNQGSSESDVSITREIRREITNAEGLSANARNVIVTTENGRVSLKGTVNSTAEREKIVAIAKKAANGNVDDQLVVKNITTSALD